MPQNPGLVDFASGPDGGVPCDLGLSIYKCLRRNLAFFRYWGCSFEASYPVCSPADTGCMAAEGSSSPSGAAGATSEVGDGGLPRLIVQKPPLARSRVADSCCVCVYHVGPPDAYAGGGAGLRRSGVHRLRRAAARCDTALLACCANPILYSQRLTIRGM